MLFTSYVKRNDISVLQYHALFSTNITLSRIFISKSPVIASLAFLPRTVPYTVPLTSYEKRIVHLIAMVAVLPSVHHQCFDNFQAMTCLKLHHTQTLTAIII
jgi:hypothetical protein